MPSVEELAEIVAWHDERRLMDYVTCGTGSYFDFYQIIPPSLYEQRLGEPFAAALKAVVRHALVQAESHIRTPAAAEAVLAAGHADMVSIVRGQIADPHLVAKARAGPRRRGPAVHLVQPAVLGPSLARLLDLVPRQPVGRARVGVGRRPVRAGGGRAARAGRRWRTGRARDGPGRGGARARGDALGARRRPRRPVPARRSPAVARPDHGPDRVVRPAGWPRSAWTCGSAWRRRPTRSPRSGRTRSSSRPASRPARAGFQRALPMVDRLPGVDEADVVAIHDVLDGTAARALGRRVLVLDDLNDWRGLGTALALAETGPRDDDRDLRRRSSPAASSTARPTARFAPATRRPAADRSRAPPSSAGAPAGRRSARPSTGAETVFDADTLVIAETPVAETALATDLTARGIAFHLIGDAVAPASRQPRLLRGAGARPSPLTRRRAAAVPWRPARPRATALEPRGDQMAVPDLEHPTRPARPRRAPDRAPGPPHGHRAVPDPHARAGRGHLDRGPRADRGQRRHAPRAGRHRDRQLPRGDRDLPERRRRRHRPARPLPARDVPLARPGDRAAAVHAASRATPPGASRSATRTWSSSRPMARRSSTTSTTAGATRRSRTSATS